MGDVLLRTGVERHQEFLPTSTCCCFVLKRFLVLESGYLTWWVETLLFLWKLFPAVKQNICFLMNGSASCEFVFCLLLSSGHFCATDSYGWLLNQILVIAPTPTPASPGRLFWLCSGCFYGTRIFSIFKNTDGVLETRLTQKGDSNSENITLVGEYIWGR